MFYVASSVMVKADANPPFSGVSTIARTLPVILKTTGIKEKPLPVLSLIKDTYNTHNNRDRSICDLYGNLTSVSYHSNKQAVMDTTHNGIDKKAIV